MITSSDVHTHHNRRCRSRPAQYHMEMTISNILRDKSFVDDLNKEQGIVSMRVGSALRSTEIKPLFPDLWRTQRHVCCLRIHVLCFRQLKSPGRRGVQAPNARVLVLLTGVVLFAFKLLSV